MAEWKNGTFGCFENCKLCIMTFICPCIVVGQTAEKVGESCCKCAVCVMIPIANIFALLKIRELVREKKGIEGTCCKDLLCFWLCGFCTIIQTAREVEDDPPSDGQAMARE